MTGYSSQLREEQRAVSRAYDRLDELRGQVRTRLDTVRAAGSHGSPTQRTERDSFATMYEDRLTQLRAVEDRLVFGRIDNTQGDRRYIGRIGLSSTTHEPILTDWRAEAARPFYEATPTQHGDIVLRRHITLNMREVVGIEDEVLDVHSSEVDKAASSGTLTGEGALLASLGSRRTGRMTDIVATIQAEQDRIIRAPLDRVTLVQGGPGTGKTAVALHRAAYLLYTHRRTLEHSGVLIVGPSHEFLHYIDQVLPSLGETGVVSRTIDDLIPGLNASGQDTPQAARLKGDARMHQAVANAIAARVRIPPKLPTVKINRFAVPMLAADIEQAQRDARHTRQPHNRARTTFVRSMLESLCARYSEQLDYTPEASELAQAAFELRTNDDIRAALNLAWLPMNAQWLIDQMFSKPEQLRRFAPWLTDEEINALIRPKGSPVTKGDIPLIDEAMDLLGPDPKTQSQEESRSQQLRREERQFAQDTLAQAGIGSGIVTSQMLMDGMNIGEEELTSQRAASDRQWTYGHVVIDEAQELTAMEWRMLLRRCPTRSFTIVGDVAQTSALGGTRHWSQTLDPLFGNGNWDLDELTINYRNPQAVSQLATNFAAREGLYVSTIKAVRDVPGAVTRTCVADEDELGAQLAQVAVELAQQFAADDGSGRVAIIVADHRVAAAKNLIDSALLDGLDPERYAKLRAHPDFDEQVVVGTANSVKGLEYDAVVVVEPGEIERRAPSALVAASSLYVAMTRPTQRLVILQTQHDKQSLEL